MASPEVNFLLKQFLNVCKSLVFKASFSVRTFKKVLLLVLKCFCVLASQFMYKGLFYSEFVAGVQILLNQMCVA